MDGDLPVYELVLHLVNQVTLELAVLVYLGSLEATK